MDMIRAGITPVGAVRERPEARVDMEQGPREPRPRRKNPRLPHYDYSQSGVYFVTLVTKYRELIFDHMPLRGMAETHWRWLAEQYAYVHVDEFVVMPNHLHGIIAIGTAPEGRSRTAPTGEGGRRKRLGSLVGAYKTVSTQAINRALGLQGHQVWQRSFYEHVIRTAEDIERVREYIKLNPSKWHEDPENPAVSRLASRSEPTGIGLTPPSRH
jgi:putative transposase